jgi:cell division protein FtsL
MAHEPFEYAVKKDVRNNPIVREVDRARQRDILRAFVTGGLFVVVLVFWAWQQHEFLQYGYRFEQTQQELAAEEETSRHLRLELATLSAPALIERRAIKQLGMVPPSPGDATIIERVIRTEAPSPSIVARR